MILHTFFPSILAKSFNKYRFQLNLNSEMISNRGFDLNNKYWDINPKEELLCNEDYIEESKHFHDFSDDCCD